MEEIKGFTVRVYGLFIEEGKVLLSDEDFAGKHFTKFPGGGLEFGEGTFDCLKREVLEELNSNCEVISHFYTTDFMVQSAFDFTKQVISIYYLARLESVIENGYQSPEGETFRWEELKSLSSDDLTFPIDQKVLEMLQNQTS